jgi:hypothetical protein
LIEICFKSLFDCWASLNLQGAVWEEIQCLALFGLYLVHVPFVSAAGDISTHASDYSLKIFNGTIVFHAASFFNAQRGANPPPVRAVGLSAGLGFDAWPSFLLFEEWASAVGKGNRCTNQYWPALKYDCSQINQGYAKYSKEEGGRYCHLLWVAETFLN